MDFPPNRRTQASIPLVRSQAAPPRSSTIATCIVEAWMVIYMIIVTPIYWLFTADATKKVIIGALVQVVSIGLGLCLGYIAFMYAASILHLI